MNQCYQCASPVGADGAAVCGACVRTAIAAIRNTAEFSVPSLPPDAGDSATMPAASGACAWCGKAAADVRKLLGNGAVAICNECVALCADVMEAELGDGWRG